MRQIQKLSWKTAEVEKLTDALPQNVILDGTVAQVSIERGGGAARHSHRNEEFASIVSGAVKYVFDDCEIVVKPGETLVVPSNVAHWVVALEDSVAILFFSPARQEQIRGEVRYFRFARRQRAAQAKSRRENV
ncbi:MAG TPA: cupin domain-containing protein [Candidatus Sulfotelmatobacter sp.]|nr:cupin domain-containing protein [Candidatus Sulfotelmatobacter sp.]